MLDKWKISHLLSLIIFCIVVFIISGMILVNYLFMAGSVKEEILMIRDHSEQMINNSFHQINTGLGFYDNSFNDEMLNGFSQTMEAYNHTGGDLARFNLNNLSRKLDGMEVYVINRSAVIVKSSNTQPLLDFNTVCPDETDFFKNIGNINGFYPDRIVMDYHTGNLTKYAYMITPDHQYIIALALSRQDFSQQRLGLNYTTVMNRARKLNPDVVSYRLFRKDSGLVDNPDYNATSEERSIISRVFRDRKSLEFLYPENGTTVKYLFVDMRDEQNITDMSLIVEITYHDHRIQEKLNDLLIYHLILGGVAIICGILLSFLISRKITRPIEDLVEDVNKLADGDLDHTIRTGVSIELLKLQESQIRLVSSIKKLIDNLHGEEQKLQQSEERYRSVVEAQQDLICRFSPDGKNLFMNEAYTRVFGSTGDHRPGSRFTREMNPEERRIVNDHFSFLTKTEPTSSIEEKVHTCDGTIRWVQWNDTAVFDKNGTITEYQSVGRDITSLKLLDESLRASDVLYQSTINAMIDGVHVIDCSYTLLLINIGFNTWMELPPVESLVHQYLFDVFPFLGDKIKREYEEVFTTGKMKITEEQYNLNKRIIHTETRKIPIYFDDHVEKIVTIVRDITDKRQIEIAQQNLNQILEHEVKVRTQELETTVKELDSFTYTVSHDLRAPLRAIDGFTHILKFKADPDKISELTHYLTKIHENIRIMDQLIEDLLNFSKISRRGIEISSIDMQTLAWEVITDLKSRYPLVRFEITVDGLPQVPGDITMMRQVFFNLLSNAMKFSQKKNQPRIKVGYTMVNGVPEYFVQDNGIGFDIQYADKIFDVFYRLHPAGEYEGTGVGLAIVKRIISRHGGDIRVISEEGSGTTFFFKVGRIDGTK